jgi:hypothetical protein
MQERASASDLNRRERRGRRITSAMWYMLLASVFAVAEGAPKQGRTLCEAGPALGKSSSGITQVSNLGLIDITCRIAARRTPKSGIQYGLRVDAKVYQLSPDGARRLVPSTLNLSGGGQNLDIEHVNFYLGIPLDVSDRDAAIRAYLSYLSRQAASSQDEKDRNMAPLLQKMGPGVFAPIFRQNRVGRFQVDCRVLDEGKVVGVGRADLEVVFKGNFFDQPQFHDR